MWKPKSRKHLGFVRFIDLPFHLRYSLEQYEKAEHVMRALRLLNGFKVNTMLCVLHLLLCISTSGLYLICVDIPGCPLLIWIFVDWSS